MAKHEAVVFLDSNGEEISNDPIYLAKKRLADAGVEEETTEVDVEAMRAEIEAKVRAEIEAEMAQRAAESSGSNNSIDYGSMDQKQLKELAKTRDLTIPKEVTTVPALRDFLRANEG